MEAEDKAESKDSEHMLGLTRREVAKLLCVCMSRMRPAAVCSTGRQAGQNTQGAWPTERWCHPGQDYAQSALPLQP
jgi:hypothetical protein